MWPIAAERLKLHNREGYRIEKNNVLEVHEEIAFYRTDTDLYKRMPKFLLNKAIKKEKVEMAGIVDGETNY